MEGNNIKRIDEKTERITKRTHEIINTRIKKKDFSKSHERISERIRKRIKERTCEWINEWTKEGMNQNR